MPNCNNCDAKITKKNPYKNGFCNKCAEHEISPDFKFSSSNSLKSRSSSRSRSKKSRSSSRSRSRRSTPKISPVSINSKRKKSLGGSRKRRKGRNTRKNRK